MDDDREDVPAVRRVQQVTHGLTLDLYLRTGLFWDRIREAWQIKQVPREIPPRVGHPREPQTGLFHHPPEYRYPGPVTLDSSEPWDRFFAFCRDWLDDFPRDDGNFALVFLRGCAWYDPPHDDLLGGWHPMAEKQDPPPPGLPITWIPDLEDLMTDSAAERSWKDAASPGTYSGRDKEENAA